MTELSPYHSYVNESSATIHNSHFPHTSDWLACLLHDHRNLITIKCDKKYLFTIDTCRQHPFRPTTTFYQQLSSWSGVLLFMETTKQRIQLQLTRCSSAEWPSPITLSSLPTSSPLSRQTVASFIVPYFAFPDSSIGKQQNNTF